MLSTLHLMVIEFLTFDVDPADRDEWMAHEERHWSRFLETRRGFAGKEMWVEADVPGRVHAVIRWDSMEAWQAVTRAEVKAVDAAMGRWHRDASVRTFQVIRDC